MSLFNKKNKIYATNNGTIRSLTLLKDGVFSKKMLGDGIAILPNKEEKIIDILSPVNGKLVMVFPTNHAFGIKTKNGIEILVHIGINTVNLKGKGFNAHVSQNSYIKLRDKLATIDLEYLRKHVSTIDIIIIVTSNQKIHEVSSGIINVGEKIFEII